eukprot:9498340-Pyramimonas_sp.AAC.1
MQDSLGFACLGYVAARASPAHSITDADGAPHSTEVELLGALWAAIYALQLPWEEQVYIVCENMAAVGKASNRVRLVSYLDKLAAI